MMAEWPTLALYWYGRGAADDSDRSIRSSAGRSRSTSSRCRRWKLLSGWLMTLAVIACAIAIFFVVVSGGMRVLDRGRLQAARAGRPAGAGCRMPCAALLLLARRPRVSSAGSIGCSSDHTIFAGVTYTDAHVTLTGLLIVSVALVVGAAHRARQRRRRPARPLAGRRRSSRPPSCYVLVSASSAGTSTASSSSRTSWCASARTSRTTSR